MKFFYLFIFLVLSSEAFSASRFALLSGYGSGSSTNEKTFSEGPLMIMMKLDVDLLPNWVVGLEHSRALGTDDNSSDISETSFGVRYHFLNAVAFKSFQQSRSDKVHFSLQRKGFSPYLGTGVGFASSGAKEAEKSKNNSFSLTLKLKGGMHWQLTSKYGLDFDGSYSLPLAGNGEIVFLSAGIGFYYNF